MLALEQRLHILARSQRIGRLKRRDDDLRDIIVRVFEKLHRNEFRALAGYFSIERPPSFSGWMRRVVRSCAIDHMRSHPEFKRSATGSDERWVSLATLGSAGAEANAPSSVVYKRRQVLRDVADIVARVDELSADEAGRVLGINRKHTRRVAKKGAHYGSALELLFAGHSYPEIADQLGLTRREVELIVQYVEELLTAKYRPTSEE